MDIKVTAWACTSAGSCAVGFVSAALPFLQFAALVISIAAGIKALVSRVRK